MALTDKQRTPPKSAQNNAKKAIAWRDKYPKETRGAGTSVGWRRARQLANGGPLSEDIIKRMAQFNRHRQNAEVDPKYKNEPWRDKGYLMWMAWGGTTGIDWAIERTEMMKDKSGGSKMELKHMNVSFQVKEYNDEDEYFSFAGYGSTANNVDLGNDRVMPGAFKQCIEEMARSGKNLPVLWQHDMSMPLGTYVEMYEDAKGLYVKGRMPKADDFVRGRVMPQMKAGSIDSMSIGYMANQWEMDGDVRNLKEITLYEISLVTMPMNPDAMITDMKTKEVGIDDFKELTVREIDSVLRSGVKMTRKATKKFISCLDVEKLRDAEDDSARDAGKGIDFDLFKAMIEEIKKI